MNAHVEQGEREREIEELKTLAAEVGQVAYDVHHYFGNGLLERVYESALTHRLDKMGHFVERQKPLNVFDENGYCVGEYFADMVVDGKLIVELKADDGTSVASYELPENSQLPSWTPLELWSFQIRAAHCLCPYSPALYLKT